VGFAAGLAMSIMGPEASQISAFWAENRMKFGDLIMSIKEGIFGMIVILFLIFEPDGMAHRWRLIKAYWKLYPFSY
jgi:branched-chain amino acid transport system permease protein